MHTGSDLLELGGEGMGRGLQRRRRLPRRCVGRGFDDAVLEPMDEVREVVLPGQVVDLVRDGLVGLGGVLVDHGGDVVLLHPPLEPDLLGVVVALDVELERDDGVLALDPDLVGEEEAAGDGAEDQPEDDPDGGDRRQPPQQPPGGEAAEPAPGEGPQPAGAEVGDGLLNPGGGEGEPAGEERERRGEAELLVGGDEEPERDEPPEEENESAGGGGCGWFGAAEEDAAEVGEGGDGGEDDGRGDSEEGLGEAGAERLRPEPDEGGLDAAEGDGAEHRPLDGAEEVVEEAEHAIEEEDGEGQASVRHGYVDGEPKLGLVVGVGGGRGQRCWSGWGWWGFGAAEGGGSEHFVPRGGGVRRGGFAGGVGDKLHLSVRRRRLCACI